MSQNNYVYDGSAKKPSVTVKLNGKTLRENEDYIVAYSSNIDVRTTKVIIIGKGSYIGIETANFIIAKTAGQSETYLTLIRKV